MMKILMITNSLCYHQVYFADCVYNLYHDNFKHLSTREPLAWRIANKQEGFVRPYSISFKNNSCIALHEIKNADVILYGDCPLKLIAKAKKGATIIKMSERPFKPNYLIPSFTGKIKQLLSFKYMKHLSKKYNYFLFSIGGMTYKDYLKVKLFKNKAYSWGYFPFFEINDINSLLSKKNSDIVEIIWVCRLIPYKQPLQVVELVKQLICQGYDNFHLTMIGDGDSGHGECYQAIKEASENVSFKKHFAYLGKIDADKVKKYYDCSSIALFTSDFSEGWGVGLNEAMASGCACICSDGLGSVQAMIENKVNGLIYHFSSTDELIENTKKLIDDKVLRTQIAKKGYSTIAKLWNCDIAAKRLYEFLNSICNGKDFAAYNSGPLSQCVEIDENWFLKVNNYEKE